MVDDLLAEGIGADGADGTDEILEIFFFHVEAGDFVQTESLPVLLVLFLLFG